MNKELTKEEYIDIIEFLDFFYGDNLIATAELRKEKPKEVQEEDLMNFKSKIDKLKELINKHFDNTADFKGFKLYSKSYLKKITKRELIDYIYLIYGNWKITDWFYNNAIKLAESFEKRIDELESNPPLKFEELHEGMWCWDNLMQKYMKIEKVILEESIYYHAKTIIEYMWHESIPFEENRFYRYEVKENEE